MKADSNKLIRRQDGWWWSEGSGCDLYVLCYNFHNDGQGFTLGKFNLQTI